MTNEIVHLHNHSNHSFLDGQASVKNMVARAKELGLDMLAMTDHGNIFGWMKFYQECKKKEIKPILGCEFYLTDDHEAKNRRAHHLVVLAENSVGLNNIIQLTTRANENFYYKPRIDFKDLERHKEGIIVLTACMHGPVSYWLFDKMTWPVAGEEPQLKEAANIPEAYRFARELYRILGPKQLFLEVQDGGIPEQLLINKHVREIAEEMGLNVVATQDAHYVNESDALAHSFLKAMAFGKSAVEEGSHGFSTNEFYLKNRELMLDSDLHPAELDMARVIATRCDVELELHKMRLPQYPTDDPRPSFELLKEKLRKGWTRRNIQDDGGEYAKRVNHELADIEQAGLADYFLIVSDITDYCRNNDIMLGAGRGSVGGSLVSFLLGITNVIDPIKYGLIWERFYNAGRVGSMPDIDTDVEKSRRDEVIAYIRKRFGEKRVAQIVTLSSLGAKQVLRDVFKVAGVDENIKNIVAGLVPAKNEDHASITLEEAIKAVPKLKEYAEDDKKFEIARGGRIIRTTSWKELFDIAQRLEGCYKTSGVHAAAVVIADDDFDRAGVPLVKGAKKEDLICGWDMDAVDAFGLLKVDILGIATLDVLRSALNLVKARHDNTGITTPMEFLDNLPLDDPKVFELLADGFNQGIFQVESSLGKAWSKKCSPKSVEEIAELVAIIRPACLDTGMSETYAKIKNGEESPSYIHPILKPVLEPTKGILLYQEQVMAICQAVAGMDLKNADAVRKVIGKKKPEELREKQQQFMDGAVKTVPQDVAEKIWGWIEKQAGYGFNKSHAVGYAIMAYWTAWMKANYYMEFLCANLMHAKDKANQQRTPQDVIAQFVNDGKLQDIDIVPPSLENSEIDFAIVNETTISYGFSHIKGVGASAIKAIKACRGAQSFTEFLNLAAVHKMNKQVVEAFICAGVLDGFRIPRRAMKAQYSLWAATTAKEREQLPSFSGTLLEQISALVDEKTIKTRKAEKIRVPNVNRRAKLKGLIEAFQNESHRDTVAQILMWEKHYLGATLSGSMADLNRAMSGARHTCKQLGMGEIKQGGYIDICVVVESMREVTVKRGKTQGRQMAFITLSDSTYSLDGSCAFPDLYDKVKTAGIDVGDVVSVTGKMSDRGLIINKMRLL
jgi:DNA polymerase-3 subunit alpha